MRTLIIALTLLGLPLGAGADSVATSAGPISVTRVLGGLNEPWGLAFLPGGGFLTTERGGRLIHVTNEGAVLTVSNLPRIFVSGQGGLLDIMVPRDFARSRQIFLSHARQKGHRAGTALSVATLSQDGKRLENVGLFFEMKKQSRSDVHFGSRIVEGPGGHIFLTIGERGDRDQAQNLDTHNGTIIRLNRDGSVPADNPFVGVAGALPEIWSYGHRNPQGAALDLQGRLWVNEHGAKGGDEVNRIVRGANYGWPVISYGTHYTGFKIGEGTAKAGMEQPAHFWDPSIAPSGMMIYSGKLWADWRGDFFIGSLKFDYLSRLDPDAGWAEERIKGGETGRVRDVREAPDGTIWFLSVDNGAVYRISPG